MRARTMHRLTTTIWLAICLAGCHNELAPSEPKRPATVPQGAIWSGGPKSGDWGKCETINSTQVKCEFFSRYGEVKKLALYERCLVRRFRPTDFRFPIGVSPTFLENQGMGWIDSAMIQFVPFGDVEVYNWNTNDSDWMRNTQLTESWTKTTRELAAELCKQRVLLQE